MGKIIVDKNGLRKKYIRLKCNGCSGCQFHYCVEDWDGEKLWDDLCRLHKHKNGMREGKDYLLAAEGYSGYAKGLEMMKTGLHPEGKVFLRKEVKKYLK